eukprot:3037089-Prymnesium_polylepis.1
MQREDIGGAAPPRPRSTTSTRELPGGAGEAASRVPASSQSLRRRRSARAPARRASARGRAAGSSVVALWIR